MMTSAQVQECGAVYAAGIEGEAGRRVGGGVG